MSATQNETRQTTEIPDGVYAVYSEGSEDPSYYSIRGGRLVMATPGHMAGTWAACNDSRGDLIPDQDEGDVLVEIDEDVADAVLVAVGEVVFADLPDGAYGYIVCRIDRGEDRLEDAREDAEACGTDIAEDRLGSYGFLSRDWPGLDGTRDGRDLLNRLEVDAKKTRGAWRRIDAMAREAFARRIADAADRSDRLADVDVPDGIYLVRSRFNEFVVAIEDGEVVGRKKAPPDAETDTLDDDDLVDAILVITREASVGSLLLPPNDYVVDRLLVRWKDLE